MWHWEKPASPLQPDSHENEHGLACHGDTIQGRLVMEIPGISAQRPLEVQSESVSEGNWKGAGVTTESPNGCGSEQWSRESRHEEVIDHHPGLLTTYRQWYPVQWKVVRPASRADWRCPKWTMSP